MLAACAARLEGKSNLVWVDMGGGTGENVAMMAEFIDALRDRPDKGKEASCH